MLIRDNLFLRFSEKTYGFRCQFEHSCSLNLKQVVFPKPGRSSYRYRLAVALESPAQQVEVDSLPAVVSCGEHAYALDFLFWPFSLHDSIYFLTVRGYLHPARRPISVHNASITQVI
jgi:hypothetical protein